MKGHGSYNMLIQEPEVLSYFCYKLFLFSTQPCHLTYKELHHVVGVRLQKIKKKAEGERISSNCICSHELLSLKETLTKGSGNLFNTYMYYILFWIRILHVKGCFCVAKTSRRPRNPPDEIMDDIHLLHCLAIDI